MTYRDATEKHMELWIQELLKEAEVMPTNEDRIVGGQNPYGAPDPELAKQRAAQAGTIDRPWGERGPEGKPDPALSEAVYGQFIRSRDQLLDDLFETKRPSTDQSRKTISELLDRTDAQQSSAPTLSKQGGDTVRERARLLGLL